MTDAPTPDDIESIISTAAEGQSPPPLSNDDLLQKIADKVELLEADNGKWEEYKAASIDYIKQFSSEVTWHKWIRFGVTILCLVILACLSTFLCYCVLNSKQLFADDKAHSLTALIIASITGIVLITMTLTKGAFALLSQRNEGLPMPEHIKELVDAGKIMKGGIGTS